MNEYFFIELERSPFFFILPRSGKFIDVPRQPFFLRLDLTDQQQERWLTRG